MPEYRPATDEEIARMRQMRADRLPWDVIGPAFGMSRYWAYHVAERHGFGQPLPSPIRPSKPPLTPREAFGGAPLPAFHPLAMAELRRAREIEL